MNAETERWLKLAPKLFRDIPDGWQFFIESSGSWSWCHPDKERTVYASPFWDGLDGIPVQESDDWDREIVNVLIPFALTGDDTEDARRYLQLVSPYLTN